MEFGEFVQLAAKFIVEEDAEAMQKELREAFRLYDKQGNGYIPTTCLKEILKELDDQLTEHELDIMIEEIDSDGSGTVDFDGEYSILLLFYLNSLGSSNIICNLKLNNFIKDQMRLYLDNIIDNFETTQVIALVLNLSQELPKSLYSTL